MCADKMTLLRITHIYFATLMLAVISLVRLTLNHLFVFIGRVGNSRCLTQVMVIVYQNWEQLTIECGWSTAQYVERMKTLLRHTFIDKSDR